jgi:hypothetical protein
VFAKIDIRDIVRDHLATLVDYRTQRASPLDYVLFFVVPAVVAAALMFLKVGLTDSAVNVLITALSIFAGLLFNLLVLIASLADKRAAPTGESDARQVMKSIYANIAYSLLVSLLTLLPLGLFATLKDELAKKIAMAVSYYFIVHFALTLMMVLKRMHILLSFEFSKGKPSA